MTREEAIWTLENGAWWDSLNDYMSDADKNPLFDALDMAISALRDQQEQEKNDPLTLDELRQMDGEPVWADHWHGGEWIIVHWDYVRRIASTYKACLHEHEYGKTWLAYRHKPEEGTE